MCLALRHDKVHDPRPRYEGYQPNVVYHGGGPRRAGFHTSGTEILHLAVAVVVLTIGFGIFLSGLRITGRVDPGFGLSPDTPIADTFLIAAIATGSGFILHELMHKFVAQFYGHWAEFRWQLVGLLMVVPLPYLLGVVFAAPGAVVISGFVKKHENGIISAAGPLTNIVIAGIAFPFLLVRGSSDTLGYDIAYMTLAINAFLAAFNMVPLGPLDGKKVWAWSKTVYAIVMAGALYLLYLAFTWG